MALNLNASPYYDDFSDSKNYHRLLFKPGFAVQARELTQVQTLLQDQLNKGFGYMLKDGAIITGCAEHVTLIPFIKVNDTDAAATTIENTALSGFKGDTLQSLPHVSATRSELRAEILDTATGTTGAAPDMKTLYLKYTSAGAQTTYTHFTSAETLTVTSKITGSTITNAGSGYSSTPTIKVGTEWAASTAVTLGAQLFSGDNLYIVTTAGSTGTAAPTHVHGKTANGSAVLGYVGRAAKATATITSGALTAINITQAGSGYTSAPTLTFSGGGGSAAAGTATVSSNIGKTFVVNNTTSTSTESGNYYGSAPLLKLDAGVIYARGQFIKTDDMTVFIDKYSKLLYKKVGFTVTETAVDSATDTSLLDPASGSFNYNAPGADRYKLTVALASIKKSDTPAENFYLYLDWENGGFKRSYTKEEPLAGLGDILASRTYDESGDYVVRGLKVNIREHLNQNDNGGLYTTAQGGKVHGLVASIEPGTGYVGGHRRQLLSTKRIEYSKPGRNVSRDATAITSGYGNYIEVTELCGVWDVDGGQVVDLYSSAQGGVSNGYSARTAQGTKVGTAKVRHIQWANGTPGAAACIYRLYLYDIKMSSGNFTAVKGIRDDKSSSNEAMADLVMNNAGSSYTYSGATAPLVKEANNNKLVYRLPYKNVKTLTDASGNRDYSFTYQKELTGTQSTNGQATFTVSAGDNESFAFSNGVISSDTTILENFIVVADASFTADSQSVVAGQVADLRTSGNSWGGSTPAATVTVNSATSITVDLGSAPSSGTGSLKAYITVTKTSDAFAAKTLNESKYVKIDTGTHPEGTGGTYSLGVSDGYKIESITAGTNSDYSTGQVDVTSHFRFDNGQSDNYYGHSKIIKKSTSSYDLSTNRYIVVKLSFFSHNYGTNGPSFFCVDSYPIDDDGALAAGNIRTESIPLYLSEKYGDFDLRDCVDFRPRMADTAANTGTLGSATVNPDTNGSITGGLTNPTPTTTFTTDLCYYQGKGLRLVLTEDGAFKIIESAFADVPTLPNPEAGSMTLATMLLPAFPCLSPAYAKQIGRPDYGIQVKQIDNRRYTMRDISTIEQRISRLEYYASLNLLETYAKESTIVSSTGADRWKNGILVDPFTGHNIGAVTDPDYKIAIDSKEQHARPFFNMENIETQFKSGANNLFRIGQSLTLPWTYLTYLNQDQASETINLAQELTFSYVGDLYLTPNVDNFVDKSVQPAVNVNFDGNYDAWENMANAWGTDWGSWENLGVANVSTTTSGSLAPGGGGLTTTTTTEQRQTRQGIRTEIIPEIQSQNLGERVIDTSISPFMRERAVTFIATRLKPNTRVYPYFDGEDVTAHCYQDANSDLWSGDNVIPTVGSALWTDENGSITGVFRIPPGVFRTGAKVFKLTDDSSNRERMEKTKATAIYESTGLSITTQDSIVSLKTAQVNTSQFFEERSVSDWQTDFQIAPPIPIPVIPPVVQVPATWDQDTTTDDTDDVTIIPVVNNTVDTSAIVATTQVTTGDGNESGVTNAIIGGEGMGNIGNEFNPAWVMNGGGVSNGGGLSIALGDDTAGITGTEISIVPTPDTDVPDVAPFTEFRFEDFQIDLTNLNFGFLGGGFGDPIAQTFRVEGVPGGMYMPGIDLFFKNKSNEQNGVTIELREVINGTPGPRVLPGGVAYRPTGGILTSTETGGVTTFNKTYFEFTNPVYLKNNTEYCFVVKPENDDKGYDMWIGQIGENKIGTTQRITQQPAAGIMFTSANNRSWTPHQSKDVMYKLYRCKFENVNTDYTATFNNRSLDWLSIDTTTWGGGITKFPAGTALHCFSFNVTDAGTGYSSAPAVTVTNTGTGGTGLAITAVMTGSGSSQSIASLTVTNPGSGYTSAPTISFAAPTSGNTATASVTLNKGLIYEYDSLDNYVTVETKEGSFKTDDHATNPGATSIVVGNADGYATVSTVGNKIVNDIALNSAALTPEGSQVFAKVALTNTGANPNSTVFQQVGFGQTETLETEKTIYGYTNELALASPGKTATLVITMRTDRNNTSPFIDLDQLDLLCIKNDVNNDVTNETNPQGGNAASRYITRKVVLEDGQDAEDLLVYADCNIPAVADLKVYAKVQNAADEYNFQEDVPWIQLTANSTPNDTPGIGEFAEYSWKFPAKSGGVGLNASGILEYDVGALNTIPVTGGGNYSQAPAIHITGGAGTGATAQAIMNGTAISSILVTNPGRGYTSAPTVTVDTTYQTSAATLGTVTIGTVTHSGFKTFSVKIVPTTTDTAQVPKFRDFRAIALQV